MTLHTHIFSACRISPYNYGTENTFLGQAVTIMDKKNASNPLLSSHKSPLDHFFKNRAIISQSMILKLTLKTILFRCGMQNGKIKNAVVRDENYLCFLSLDSAKSINRSDR